MVTVIVYFLILVIYRLYLHPLAKLQGPKLATITRYYEAYYDIVENGQYTFKIAELRRKYGRLATDLASVSKLTMACPSAGALSFE